MIINKKIITNKGCEPSNRLLNKFGHGKYMKMGRDVYLAVQQM